MGGRARAEMGGRARAEMGGQRWVGVSYRHGYIYVRRYNKGYGALSFSAKACLTRSISTCMALSRSQQFTAHCDTQYAV